MIEIASSAAYNDQITTSSNDEHMSLPYPNQAFLSFLVLYIISLPLVLSLIPRTKWNPYFGANVITANSGSAPYIPPRSYTRHHGLFSGQFKPRRTFSPYMYNIADGSQTRPVKKTKIDVMETTLSPENMRINAEEIQSKKKSLFRSKQPQHSSMTPKNQKDAAKQKLPTNMETLWRESNRKQKIYKDIKDTSFISTPATSSTKQIQLPYPLDKYKTALPPFDRLNSSHVSNKQYGGNRIFVPSGLFDYMPIPNRLYKLASSVPSHTNVSASDIEQLSHHDTLVNNTEAPHQPQDKLLSVLEVSPKQKVISDDKLMQIVDMLMVTHNLTRVFKVMPQTGAKGTLGDLEAIPKPAMGKLLNANAGDTRHPGLLSQLNNRLPPIASKATTNAPTRVTVAVTKSPNQISGSTTLVVLTPAATSPIKDPKGMDHLTDIKRAHPIAETTTSQSGNTLDQTTMRSKNIPGLINSHISNLANHDAFYSISSPTETQFPRTGGIIGTTTAEVANDTARETGLSESLPKSPASESKSALQPLMTTDHFAMMNDTPQVHKSFIDWFLDSISKPQLVKIPTQTGNKTKSFVVVPYRDQFNIQV